mgnify:FL=1
MKKITFVYSCGATQIAYWSKQTIKGRIEKDFEFDRRVRDLAQDWKHE